MKWLAYPNDDLLHCLALNKNIDIRKKSIKSLSMHPSCGWQIP
jgi:hypothetical protein